MGVGGGGGWQGLVHIYICLVTIVTVSRTGIATISSYIDSY